MRPLLIALSALLLVAGLAALWLYRTALAALDAPLTIEQATVFAIEPGSSMGTVSAALEEQGLIEDGRPLYWYARLTDRARLLRAGEYELTPELSGRDLLERFVSGDVLLHGVTFIEGWTAAEAIAAVQAHEAVRPALDPADPAAILAALGADEGHIEGLFFPSTYRFPRGSSDLDILRQAYALMRSELAAAWDERREPLPFDTPYQALILASIIEKETGRADEREQIAGVFVRRLQRGMRLQTDPTVIYGIGPEFDGNIRRRDLTRDTPYNTYTRGGLPPTPIALSGRESMRAAVTPADGDTLYFVATGEPDGSHYFSRTLDEHEAAVRRYLVRLRQSRR
ncbi:MAG: endolytic transglycosylase MltG [Pseudomonadota bacterium]